MNEQATSTRTSPIVRLGTARRGDVVFLREPDGFSDAASEGTMAALAAVYERTGVNIVVVASDHKFIPVAPGRYRTRSGPTPRWCRR